MSTDYTLVTYNCLHFALLPPTPVYDFKDTFERLSEPSQPQSDLKRKVTSCHLSIPTSCENFACYGLSFPEWEDRIDSALSSLCKSLKSFRNVFMQLGTVYHGIPLETRVALSNEKMCGLSQQQFAIERRAWRDDPFFQPYLEAKELIKEVDNELRWSCWTDELLVGVARKINHCRALVSKVSGFENEIVAGIKGLHQLYTDKVNEEMETINSMNEKISEEKEKTRKEEEERNLAAAALAKKEEEIARARKLAEEAERIAIQQAAANKVSKRGFGFSILDKIKGKNNKQDLRLADSPKPKEPQYLESKVETASEVTQPKKEILAPIVTVVEELPKQQQLSARGHMESGMSKSGGRRRENLLRTATLTGFLLRMTGF